MGESSGSKCDASVKSQGRRLGTNQYNIVKLSQPQSNLAAPLHWHKAHEKCMNFCENFWSFFLNYLFQAVPLLSDLWPWCMSFTIFANARNIWSWWLQEDSKSFISLDNLETEIEKLLNLRQDYNFAIDKQGNKISSDSTQMPDSTGVVDSSEQQESVKKREWACSVGNSMQSFLCNN